MRIPQNDINMVVIDDIMVVIELDLFGYERQLPLVEYVKSINKENITRTLVDHFATRGIRDRYEMYESYKNGVINFDNQSDLSDNHLDTQFKDKVIGYTNDFIVENIDNMRLSDKSILDYHNHILPAYQLDENTKQVKMNVLYNILNSSIPEDFMVGDHNLEKFTISSNLMVRFDKEGLTNCFMGGPYHIMCWNELENPGRTNNIYCSNKRDMYNVLSKFDLYMDKQHAVSEIKKLEKQINKLKLDYEL